MNLPIVQGVIKRRLLINFRVDPEVMGKQLPAPFRPRLHRGFAIAGISLIRLEQIRPRLMPISFGVSSENAAHRVAVVWDDDVGVQHDGVYISRRDTSSLLNTLAGGRVFPGEHRRARFQVEDDGRGITVSMRAQDGRVQLLVRGTVTAELPADSIFASVDVASEFCERGSLGCSPRGTDRDGGPNSRALEWALHPFEVREIRSSVFDDETVFPSGSIRLDHALVMRDIRQAFVAAPDVCGQRAAG